MEGMHATDTIVHVRPEYIYCHNNREHAQIATPKNCQREKEKPNKITEVHTCKAAHQIMGPPRPLPSARLHRSRQTAHGLSVVVHNRRSVVGGSFPYVRALL